MINIDTDQANVVNTNGNKSFKQSFLFTRAHDSRLSSLAQLSARAEKTAKAVAERGSKLVGVSPRLDAYFWHVERHALGLKMSLIRCVTLSLLANAGTDYKKHNLFWHLNSFVTSWA